MNIFVAPHYSIVQLGGNGRHDPDKARAELMAMFGDEAPDDQNFVLFSTSGVHGSYNTIEDIDSWLHDNPKARDPDGDILTVLVVCPRLVHMKYGDIRVQPEDIERLKTIRAESLAAMASIGAP